MEGELPHSLHLGQILFSYNKNLDDFMSRYYHSVLDRGPKLSQKMRQTNQRDKALRNRFCTGLHHFQVELHFPTCASSIHKQKKFISIDTN